MQTCDVLVVGGGPAGSSCAWALSGSALDVCVLDRREFPRDKVCAGWITPQVVEVLRLDVDDYRRGRVWQPIAAFRTGLIGEREIETRYDRPVSFGIRRCEFDHYLLERSGARQLTPQPVDSIEQRGGRWIVNGEFSAAVLVGAGGHFCPVARHLGARHASQASVVAAQEAEFEIPPGAPGWESIAPEMPELYFCRDLAGYGWCFRKGNYLNVGLGRTVAEDLSAQMAEFCEFLSERGKVVLPLPARPKGHAYQLYERVEPTLTADGVLLVGDAAGLAYPQSGEGIRPAVESGIIAAEVIRAAKVDYRAASLAPYHQQILSRFGRPRRSSISSWLPATALALLAAKLMASRHFARRVILDRWFLHRQEPALRLQPARATVVGATGSH